MPWHDDTPRQIGWQSFSGQVDIAVVWRADNRVNANPADLSRGEEGFSPPPHDSLRHFDEFGVDEDLKGRESIHFHVAGAKLGRPHAVEWQKCRC